MTFHIDISYLDIGPEPTLATSQHNILVLLLETLFDIPA